MKWKNCHHLVKETLALYPIPHSSEYYREDGQLKKGAQRRWCKSAIREIGKRNRKYKEARANIRYSHNDNKTVKEMRDDNQEDK